DARPDGLLERGGAILRLDLRVVPDELVEEQRISLRFTRDGRDVERQPRALRQRLGELSRLAFAEARDLDDEAAGRQRRRPGRELKVGLAFVGADGRDEQERRRLRRTENVTEEREAVGV